MSIEDEQATLPPEPRRATPSSTAPRRMSPVATATAARAAMGMAGTSDHAPYTVARPSRTPSDIANAVEQGRRAMLIEILRVIDGLPEDAAISGQDPDGHLLDGIGFACERLLAHLRRVGVRPFDAAGATFDPTFHEAVCTETVRDPSYDGRIVGTLAPGYTLGGEIIRRAAVIVGRYEMSHWGAGTVGA